MRHLQKIILIRVTLCWVDHFEFGFILLRFKNYLNNINQSLQSILFKYTIPICLYMHMDLEKCDKTLWQTIYFIIMVLYSACPIGIIENCTCQKHKNIRTNRFFQNGFGRITNFSRTLDFFLEQTWVMRIRHG